VVPFYRVEDVPVHSVLLIPTREAALGHPRGDIVLAFCRTCGFIWNAASDSSLLEYSPLYEATQAFSSTFNAFHQQLARHLIERYNLRGKDLIEIGCGQGEFMTLLCKLGGNRGVGFDPACAFTGGERQPGERITFIKDFYSEKYASYQADFICCKMTLEHIQHPTRLVSTLRRAIGDRAGTVVFFQVPDVTRILHELAFWDIYYEHCSYFSPGSLTGLFRRCGFDVIDCWRAYGDQYLMIEARPIDDPSRGTREQQHAREDLAALVAYFAEACPLKVQTWHRRLREYRQRGDRVVVWGGGSKAVAFLTTLDATDACEYVVDINPRKHGTYVAGTGQEIVPPAFLRGYGPDRVIVMNPIYEDEIREELDRLGVSADLVAV
jgi:hypothetical protein